MAEKRCYKNCFLNVKMENSFSTLRLWHGLVCLWVSYLEIISYDITDITLPVELQEDLNYRKDTSLEIQFFKYIIYTLKCKLEMHRSTGQGPELSQFSAWSARTGDRPVSLPTPSRSVLTSQLCLHQHVNGMEVLHCEWRRHKVRNL